MDRLSTFSPLLSHSPICVAIIGGSGFSSFFSGDHLSDAACEHNKNTPFLVQKTLGAQTTPYGSVEGLVSLTSHDANHPFFKQGHTLYFIARHGDSHSTPPHKINYRAIIYALKAQGVTHIIATHAVGGITASCKPESLVLPNQVIDYTSGREHTYYDDFSQGLEHIDFSYPFAGEVYQRFLHTINTASKSDYTSIVVGGCYGCTQGPRLESAAEIQRLKQDGCDIVGMTAMPEAALAREQKVDYASISMVVNWAAGVEPGMIEMAEIIASLNKTSLSTLHFVSDVLASFVSLKGR